MKCRDLIDRAIEVGRELQSEQTGWIHLHDPRQPEGPHQTMPIKENLLFILALFRSRGADNIQEAKGLLEHLLHFEVEGKLPLYLHEYPKCRDKYGIALHLAILYLIATQFHTVLGEPLRKQLKAFMQRAAHSAVDLAEGPADLVCLLGAVLEKIGAWLEDESLMSAGEQLFERSKEPHPLYWYAPDRLHHYITAWQILGKEWPELEEHLQGSWHEALCCYVGPPVHDLQFQDEPEPTPYDLYLSYFSQKSSKRIERLLPFQLHGALVLPIGEEWAAPTSARTLEGAILGRRWRSEIHPSYAVITYDQDRSGNPSLQFAESALKIVWGGPKKLHSFVCQGGVAKIEASHSPLTLKVSLPAPESLERCRDLLFYWNTSAPMKHTMGGAPASVFKLGDRVELMLGGAHLQMSGKTQSEEGVFLGHLHRSNRPSQRHCRGEGKFVSYDWVLFVRSVNRDKPCQLDWTICIELREEALRGADMAQASACV